LACPEEIVDEYVRLGFEEIFLRPLSDYGFARRNSDRLSYTTAQFSSFYERAFERVLHWNRNGTAIREVAASVALNKILCPFDAGYVDLQSPSGAGLAVLLYNYDGHVYPSDEARMLAASGDPSLRLGRIGDSLQELLSSGLQQELIEASMSRVVDGCRDCAYNAYCGPDPISAFNQWGAMSVSPLVTEHCHRQMWLFDFLFHRLREGNEWFDSLARRWSQPAGSDLSVHSA
jgi:radical SAM protein with 4Fe4S-binding SPASM domain